MYMSAWLESDTSELSKTRNHAKNIENVEDGGKYLERSREIEYE